MRSVIAIGLVAWIIACSASPAHAQGGVRECANIKGMWGWFPGERKPLQDAVDKYLADAGEVKVVGKPVAVIAPHAGYRWSGPTAAYAFKPLAGRKFSRVIVMGPSHHEGFPGGSIPSVDFYRTPLGHVPLDKPACRRLLASGIIGSRKNAHDREHSIQNELPFLQAVLKDRKWKLVPIVIGPFQQKGDIERLAEEIKTIVTPGTLIVISSDFTHFGTRFHYTPFRKDLRNNIRKLDRGAIDLICASDYKGFRAYIAKTRATICGRHPIAVMLRIFEGREDIRGKLTHYAMSGDVTKDYKGSVSYASIVLTKAEPEPEAELKVEVIVDEGGPRREKEPPRDRLTTPEQKLVLQIAREQLEKAVKERRMVDPKKYGWDLTPKLMAHGAVFVTLKSRGRLRGCVGDITAIRPLYLSVIKNTTNAALADHRFRNNRITPRELSDIYIEVSYLTPQVRIESYTEIVVGKHGVLLQKGRNRSVFLPQVATQMKWDRETMLRHLSVKAGLKPDAYKEKGCTFHVFEAQAFGEKGLGLWPPKKKEKN